MLWPNRFGWKKISIKCSRERIFLVKIKAVKWLFAALIMILWAPTWWQLLSLPVWRLRWGWQSVPTAEHAAWEGASALLSARWTPLYSQYLTYNEAQKRNMNSRRNWLTLLKIQNHSSHCRNNLHSVWFTGNTTAAFFYDSSWIYMEINRLISINLPVRYKRNRKLWGDILNNGGCPLFSCTQISSQLPKYANFHITPHKILKMSLNNTERSIQSI